MDDQEVSRRGGAHASLTHPIPHYSPDTRTHSFGADDSPLLPTVLSSLRLRAKVTLKEASTMSVRREMGPISVAFEIPMYNVSSLAVRYLRIAERHKSNTPYRWVRYVTQSSSYKE